MGPRFEIFAVEDRSIQLTWDRLPAVEATIGVGDRTFEVGGEPPDWYRTRWGRRPPGGWSGPGSLVVDDLQPATAYDVTVAATGRPRVKVATAETLGVPPGRLLARVATINDLHIGERSVGLLRVLADPRPRPAGMDPYPTRCALAAIREAEAWGAGTIVAKGDLTYGGDPGESVEAARVLASASVPLHAVLGNHDVQGKAAVASTLGRAGIPVSVAASAVDVPGLRVVLGHTPRKGLHGGRLDPDHLRDLLALAHGAPGPAAILLHHPPMRRRSYSYYPPSISRGDSQGLISGLAGANRRSVVLSGHTHRNRRYEVDGITVAEVGSTKDYPGGWAGYAVHEGGIRQVVRRTADPDVLPWTQMTAAALGGVWGWWSPGRLDDRCWIKEWD